MRIATCPSIRPLGGALAIALLIAPGIAAAETRGETLWYLPAKLEATTSGTATAALGLGFIRAVPGTMSVNGSLDYTVATEDGIATLLGVNDQGQVEQTLPWSVGVNLSLISFGSAGPAVSTAATNLLVSAKRLAVATCAGECKPDADTTFCKAHDAALKLLEDEWIAAHRADIAQGKLGLCQADLGQSPEQLNDNIRVCLKACAGGLSSRFCKAIARPLESDVHNDITNQELCAAGRKILEEAEASSADHRAFPPLMLDGGVRAGRSAFSFMAPGDAPSLLVPAARSGWDLAFGTSGAWIPGPATRRWALTLEWLAVWKSNWRAAADRVRWCVPVGMVERSASALTPKPADPAESCAEATLGAPMRNRALQIAVQVGLLDDNQTAWRAALGPEVVVPLSEANPTEFRVALNALVVGTLSGGSDTLALAYKGLLRVGPAFFFEKLRSGGSSTGALLSLTVLGDRLLFSRAFDEL